MRFVPKHRAIPSGCEHARCKLFLRGRDGGQIGGHGGGEGIRRHLHLGHELEGRNDNRHLRREKEGLGNAHQLFVQIL